MARTARQTLNALSRSTNIHVRSTVELAAHVDSATAAFDKKRRDKGQGPVRRKPELLPVPRAECSQTIELTPWQVLHAVARGYVLAGQGMGRGLAEHWLSLKFCEALGNNRAGAMDLTEPFSSCAGRVKWPGGRGRDRAGPLVVCVVISLITPATEGPCWFRILP
ncbi:hypothetical protein ACIBBE_49500, partial [Streptomyces sp. NPDC051644]